MKKRITSIFILLFMTLSVYSVPKHIEEDLKVFKKYMEQCYVAYDENVELGFDLDKTIKNIKKDFDREVKWAKKTKQKYSEDEILAGRMSYHLWKDLKIKDAHFSIIFSKGGYSVVYPEKNYFSPLYFEKQGNDYILVNSYGSEIKKGSRFTDDISNLKRVIYANEEVYQYIFTTTEGNIKTVNVKLDEKEYQIPIEENVRFKNVENKKQVNTIKTKDSFYLAIGMFLNFYLEEHSEYRNFMSNIVDEFQRRPTYSNLIIDLRSNIGGVSCSKELLPSLYFFDDGAKIQSFLNVIKLSEIGSVRLESTEILKKQQEVEERKYGMREKRLKKIHEDFEKVTKQGGRYYEKSEYKAKSLLQEKPALFRGNTYLLVDNKTSSAAEDFIAKTFLVDEDKVFIVGENTSGTLDFYDTYDYELPNTKVKLTLCAESLKDTGLLSKNPKWHGDTKGFYPDYWATNETILDTLVYLTKDEELRNVLSGLGKGQK